VPESIDQQEQVAKRVAVRRDVLGEKLANAEGAVIIGESSKDGGGDWDVWKEGHVAKVSTSLDPGIPLRCINPLVFPLQSRTAFPEGLPADHPVARLIRLQGREELEGTGVSENI
jgi:hypothetical protein